MNIFPNNKSQAAALFSLEALPIDTAQGKSVRYMWTLTTPDVCEFDVISHRWLTFLKRFKRAYPLVSGVRVFELHGEDFSHGWHVHFVVGERVDVRVLRRWWDEINGRSARIHVQVMNPAETDYVAKYLSKQFREPWMKGKRLWGRWGSFKGTRVVDVTVTSPTTRAFSYCKRLRDWLGIQFRHASFYGKSTIVNWLLREDLISGGTLYGFYEPLPAECYVSAG